MKKRIKYLITFLVLIFGLFLTGCKEELEFLKGTWYCDNQITLNFTELIEYKHGDLKWWAICGGQKDNNSTCFLNNSVFFCLMGRDISETFMYKYYAYNVVYEIGAIERIDELYFNMKDGELNGIYRTDEKFGWSELVEFTGVIDNNFSEEDDTKAIQRPKKRSY